MKKQYINREQFNNLDAVFAGCWCLNFSGYSEEDNNQIKDCLHWNFKDLAQLKTSSSIINTVIQAAKVKSNKDLYFSQLLKNNNIYVL